MPPTHKILKSYEIVLKYVPTKEVQKHMTTSELTTRYLLTRKSARRSTQSLHTLVQSHLNTAPFGSLPIESVKTSDAKLFFLELQAQGKSYRRPTPAQLKPSSQILPPFYHHIRRKMINQILQRCRFYTGTVQACPSPPSTGTSFFSAWFANTTPHMRPSFHALCPMFAAIPSAPAWPLQA